MSKQGYIYIITSKANTVLYTGVTSDLKNRVFQHKSGSVKGFSKKYNVDKLVYYEIIEDMYNAITREKQLKKGSRNNKVKLIELMNPNWNDLYDEL